MASRGGGNSSVGNPSVMDKPNIVGKEKKEKNEQKGQKEQQKEKNQQKGQKEQKEKKEKKEQQKEKKEPKEQNEQNEQKRQKEQQKEKKEQNEQKGQKEQQKEKKEKKEQNQQKGQKEQQKEKKEQNEQKGQKEQKEQKEGQKEQKGRKEQKEQKGPKEQKEQKDTTTKGNKEEKVKKEKKAMKNDNNGQDNESEERQSKKEKEKKNKNEAKKQQGVESTNDLKKKKDEKKASNVGDTKSLKALEGEKTEKSRLQSLTDCQFFLAGQCTKEATQDCKYRHSLRAKASKKECEKWLRRECTELACPLRHLYQKPAETKRKPEGPPLPSPKAILSNELCPGWLAGSCLDPNCPRLHPQTPVQSFNSAPAVPHRGVTGGDAERIAYFWDIENCSVPRSMSAFDVAGRVRKLADKGSQRIAEIAFTCYGDVTALSNEIQLSLHHANVKMVHVPDRKPGAADRMILLDLDRFERTTKPPATVVLITGDIDFVYKLNDLKNHAGYRIIVIHNAQARKELIETADQSHGWTSFLGIPGKVVADPKSPSFKAPPTAKQPKKPAGNKDPPSKESRCNFCSSPFKSEAALGQHLRDKHVRCLICAQFFPDESSLQQHAMAKGH